MKTFKEYYEQLMEKKMHCWDGYVAKGKKTIKKNGKKKKVNNCVKK